MQPSACVNAPGTRKDPGAFELRRARVLVERAYLPSTITPREQERPPVVTRIMYAPVAQPSVPMVA